jgi:hypothetical protein
MERQKWYKAHLFTNASNVVDDFHVKYLNKPASRPDGLRIRQVELDTRVQARDKALEESLKLRQSARLTASK